MQVISMTEGKITQDYISRFPVGNPVGDKQIGHVPVLLRISMPRCSPITFGLRIMWGKMPFVGEKALFHCLLMNNPVISEQEGNNATGFFTFFCDAFP